MTFFLAPLDAAKSFKKSFFSVWECIAFQVSKHGVCSRIRNLNIFVPLNHGIIQAGESQGVLLVQPHSQSRVNHLMRPGLSGLSSVLKTFKDRDFYSLCPSSGYFCIAHRRSNIQKALPSITGRNCSP